MGIFNEQKILFLIKYISQRRYIMYYYGGYSGYGCGAPGYGGGYGTGYGAAIILVLFILLVIIIGARAFDRPNQR